MTHSWRSIAKRVLRPMPEWRRRRLAVEPLEDRRLLAIVTWDGLGDGMSWSDRFNWNNPGAVDPNTLPGSGDDVVIDVAANPNITVSTAATPIKSLNSAESLVLASGGSLSILETPLSGNLLSSLTLSGGTLSGTGNVTVGETLNWTSGTMSGSGTTIVTAGGALNLSNSTHQLNRVLQNDGTAAWTAGALQMQGGTFNNNGSFTANTASLLQSYGTGGTNAFNNAGTFIKLGAGTTQFTVSSSGVPFNNTGSVDVQAGTLTLDAGGTSGNTMNVAASGTLSFGSSYTHTPGGSVSGAGTLTFTNGTHSFAAGQFNPTGTVNFSGGTITVNNTFNAAALGTISAFVTFNAPESFGNLTLASGGTLSGTGNVTVGETLNWTSGTMSGSGTTIVSAGGALNLSNSTHQLNRVLQNDGTATWTAGALQMQGGTFNNNGSFTANTASLLQSYGTGGTNAFNNAGTFIKLGAGTTQFTVSSSGVPFNNTGSVDVQAGTLTLDAGGTSGNAMNVAASGTLSFGSSYTHTPGGSVSGAGTLTFTNGTHSFAAGQFNPTGTVNFSGGTITVNDTFNAAALGTISAFVTLNAPESFGNLTLAGGGTLSGSGNVTVDGTLNWTGRHDVGQRHRRSWRPAAR